MITARDFGTYRLAYPNGEVRKRFIESLLPAYVHLPGENNNRATRTIGEWIVINERNSI